jgi:hypothetical protein
MTFNKSVKLALGAKANKGSSSFRVHTNSKKWPKGLGTIAYRDSWDILTKSWCHNLIQNDLSSFRYWKTGIYNKSFYTNICQYKGIETAFRN